MQRVTIVALYHQAGSRRRERGAYPRGLRRAGGYQPPQPIAYALLRNGDEFLHLFLNLAEDDADVLTELPSFKAFSADGAARWTAPPEIIRTGMNLVDSYGFGGALAPARRAPEGRASMGRAPDLRGG